MSVDGIYPIPIVGMLPPGRGGRDPFRISLPCSATEVSTIAVGSYVLFCASTALCTIPDSGRVASAVKTMLAKECRSTSSGFKEPTGVRIGLLPNTHAAVMFSASAGSSSVLSIAAVVRAERSDAISGSSLMMFLLKTSTLIAALSHLPGGGRSAGTAIRFPMPESSAFETTGSQMRNASIWWVLSSWGMVPAEAYRRLTPGLLPAVPENTGTDPQRESRMRRMRLPPPMSSPRNGMSFCMAGSLSDVCESRV
ncbi:MAG: hypothetical protein CVV32_00100 [Methanomicrobiales archaeon HGW-Methanomicrobiales-3]|nr:MAG: hypothetical protein CVV32_00100 [Methanomicrobiales archaeon HGW-Methanomicrobiales-3]